MADLGKAYVQIVPSAKGIEGSISKELNGEAQTAGDEAGNTLGSSLVSKVKTIIAAAAIGEAFKESLQAGADLQQSMGGIETLFKNSASTVQQYATTAFQRAGVSANEYMEQVTSFSASLLSSLGGDTAQAAEYADRAMVDMSDNANKFGTDIESIQNAYQGFAKQNYTMLDNLKLGYGGTKEEMQRLISDASKMTGAMDELGVSVDESDMSFSNIVNAISVVQKNMDITGTTSKEAATTFSGSFNSMKAAATDFMASLTGVTDSTGNAILSVSDSMSNLISSAFTFAFGNLIPMVANIAVNLPGAIIEGLNTGIPMLVSEVKNMASNIPEGFEESIPDIIEAGFQSILQLSQTIRESAGDLISIGCDLLLKLAEGFASAIPTFITYIPQIIDNLVNTFNDNREKILQTGIQLIYTIAEGLLSAIPALVASIPTIVQTLWDFFIGVDWLSLGSTIINTIALGCMAMWSSIPDILKQICDTTVETIQGIDWVNLGSQIITFIVNGVQALFDFIPSALTSIGQTAEGNFKNIDWASVGNSVINLITSGISAIGDLIWGALNSAGSYATSAFDNLGWNGIGGDIINGIVGGIASMGHKIYDKLSSIASSALEKVKDLLGIGSPSKVFRDQVGQWIPAGISVGIEADKTLPNAIDEMAENATAQAQVALGDIKSSMGLTSTATPATSNSVNNATVVNQTINSAKALTPSEIAQETQDMMRRLKWA